MLNLDQIKEAHGPRTLELDVPEWGGKVLARRLSASDYIVLTDGHPGEVSGEKAFDYMVEVVERSLVNDDGSRLIDDEHRYLLGDSPALVTRLAKQLLAFNRLNEPPKNSGGTP